jgi:hypothetical protein
VSGCVFRDNIGIAFKMFKSSWVHFTGNVIYNTIIAAVELKDANVFNMDGNLIVAHR